MGVVQHVERASERHARRRQRRQLPEHPHQCQRRTRDDVVARVAAVSTTAIVVADTANPTGGFTDAEYLSFATVFDTLIGPLDIQNFGNLLNSNWGVGQRVIRNQILTNPGVDAQGRATYRIDRPVGQRGR